MRNEQLRLSVAENGAELRSLVCAKTGREWMWQANPEFWPRTSPVLFPIVGKLKDNLLHHADKSWSLSQHGFARDRHFQLVSEQHDLLRFRLENSEEDLLIFPFPFILEIAYFLEENQIRISYHVENPGPDRLPFSIGAHPGFALEGWPEKAYYLQFPGENAIEYMLLKDGLLDDTRVFLLSPGTEGLKISPGLFASDALIFKNPAFSEVVLVPEDGSHRLSVGFEGFPDLGIWSKPGAPFVCIEPWFGHADPINFQGAIFEKPGIICLESMQKFDCSFTLALIS